MNCQVCEESVDTSTAIQVPSGWVHPEECRAIWVENELRLWAIFGEPLQSSANNA